MSMLPSRWASSSSIISSSWDTLESSLVFSSLEINFFHWEKMKLMGVSTWISRLIRGGAEHGKLLGEVLGNALGGDLAEDQHHHGDHHRGKGGANVPVQLHKQQGGDGGHGTVFSPIVKGLRPFFSRMRRPCSFFFPLFKAHLWAIPAQPSKTATRSSRITRSALPS